jgi:hypothetical protein
MNDSRPAWLLLITNQPGQNQTLRMRVWRALKAAGPDCFGMGSMCYRKRTFLGTFSGSRLKRSAVAGGAHVRVLSLNQQTRGSRDLRALVHDLEKDENVRGDRAVAVGFPGAAAQCIPSTRKTNSSAAPNSAAPSRTQTGRVNTQASRMFLTVSR